VTFAVLDLRVAEVVRKRRLKLLSFFYNNRSGKDMLIELKRGENYHGGERNM